MIQWATYLYLKALNKDSLLYNGLLSTLKAHGMGKTVFIIIVLALAKGNNR